MTSPDAFFIFSKFWFSGLLGRGENKGKKWPKMTKKNCLTPYLRNCTSYDCGFWYTCVKWWYLQQHLFSFFQNSDFSGFSKFINKCQKEILRCAPPSSHVCDFFNRTKTFFTYKVFFSKKYKKVLFQRISLENIKDATTMSRQQIKIYMQRIKMSRWSTKIDCDFFDKG